MRIFNLKPTISASALGRITGHRRHWGWRIVKVVALGICLAVGYEAVRVLFLGNIHEVIPGRVYRSAQLSPESLRKLIESRGIRTVINLRGCCNPFEWYLGECRTTHDLNVSQEDITFSAIRLPAPSEVRQLIEVLDRSEYPIVFHCRQGADRTGLTATIVMLLLTDADLVTARRQCSPRYSHLPVLSTAYMDLFFDMYENWLKQQHLDHTPANFRHWAEFEYRPDPAPAKIELLGEPPRVARGESTKFTVRAHNRSNAVWEFKTGTVTGIYVRTVIEAPTGKTVGLARAGRFVAQVAPGESIDVEVALPPFHEEGPHRIIVDLADHHVNFCQLGSDWLEFEIQVGPPQAR